MIEPAYIPRTGDIVCLRYTKPNFVQRTIASFGSLSTHNELIVVKRNGIVETGYAAPPCFTMLPFEYRKDQWQHGEITFSVFRYARFNMDVHADGPWYDQAQRVIRASILTMAKLKIPYDLRDVIAIGRNAVRAHFPWLNPLVPKMEGKVYCSESCTIAFEMAGIDLLADLPRQRFPAPIHIEKAYYTGGLEIVADFGLKADLEGNRPYPSGK